MEREKTIGFVIFRRQGRSISYLLLHHGGQYWNFPKGRQEGLETEVETALRELQEETGITNVKVIDGFREEYDYDFDREVQDGVRQTFSKKAIFFLGEVESEPVAISDEHIDFGWFDYDIALKRLFFQNGQDILKRAHQFLLKEQGFVL
ncbi:MAG: NUDIX domain-containing protein [Candidatus Buchananbacteria bacterium]